MTVTHVIVTIVAAFLGSWLVTGMLFIGFPTVERLKDQKDQIPKQLSWVIKVPVYVAIPIFLVADFLFNVLWGTVIFRELPRELLFTYRLKRHWRGGDKRQKRRAQPWVQLVNLIDPGHV